MVDYQRTFYNGLAEVTQDDLVQGCVDYLLKNSAIIQMVGKEPGTNIPFVFQTTLLKTMDGTQSNAIVVSHAGDWAAVGRTGFEGIRLMVDIYCDSLRDVDGNATIGDPEPRLRLNQIYRTVDSLLNRPVGVIWMGDVKTCDHTRLGSIAIIGAPETDGTIRGQVFYGMTIAGYRRTST